MTEMADSGRLALGGVKFFVLDEADRLLDTGNQPDILNLFQRMPKGAAGAARLQVGFCLLLCQAAATSNAKKGMFFGKHVQRWFTPGVDRVQHNLHVAYLIISTSCSQLIQSV